MVDECIFIYPDTNHKCRRIPKRGEKFCSAHRSQRRRTPGQETDAFLERMLAWRDQLLALNIDDLLTVTTDTLADIHDLILRKSSQEHRAAFLRATTAVGILEERLTESFAAYRADPRTLAKTAAPQPAPVLAPPPSANHPQPVADSSAPVDRAALNRVAAELAQPLSPDQLICVIGRMLTILDPNGSTPSTLPSNGYPMPISEPRLIHNKTNCLDPTIPRSNG